MNKKIVCLICLLITCFSLSGCVTSMVLSKANAREKTLFLPESSETISSSISTSNAHDDHSFEVEISENTTAGIGNDFFSKEEEVIISLQSENPIKLDVMICPVDKNGEYDDDKAVMKTVEIHSEECEVSLIVPEDGNYTLRFQNKMAQSVQFTGVTNRKIKNEVS